MNNVLIYGAGGCIDPHLVLSRMLKRPGIKHQALNAKHHKSESEIVRDAGQPGAVTVATNMASCGTAIKLGKWGTEDGQVITHGLVTKTIERAQKRVETGWGHQSR